MTPYSNCHIYKISYGVNKYRRRFLLFLFLDNKKYDYINHMILERLRFF